MLLTYIPMALTFNRMQLPTGILLPITEKEQLNEMINSKLHLIEHGINPTVLFIHRAVTLTLH